MATARFGKGVQVKRGNTATVGETNFTLIPAFIGTVNGPGGNSDIKDITTHDTVGRLRAKAAGLADAGSLDGELLFDPDDAIHQAVLQDWLDGTFRDYSLVLPTGIVRKYGFRATVSQFKAMWPVDDYVKTTVSFTFLTVNFNA